MNIVYEASAIAFTFPSVSSFELVLNLKRFFVQVHRMPKQRVEERKREQGHRKGLSIDSDISILFTNICFISETLYK